MKKKFCNKIILNLW